MDAVLSTSDLWIRFFSRVVWMRFLKSDIVERIQGSRHNLSSKQKKSDKFYRKLYWWILKEFVSMTLRKRHTRLLLGNTYTDPVTRPKIKGRKREI